MKRESVGPNRAHYFMSSSGKWTRFRFDNPNARAGAGKDSPLLRPAFTKKCRECERYKHIREFGPRPSAPGTLPLCLDCKDKLKLKEQDNVSESNIDGSLS